MTSQNQSEQPNRFEASRLASKKFIPFDWATLPRRPLEPIGSYPKDFAGGDIQLADGRKISIRRLQQYFIYSGHMLGAMSAPEEEAYNVIKRAQSLHPALKEAMIMLPPELFIYAPPRMPLMVAPLGWDLGPVTLPRVAVIAELQSFSPARDNTECFSSLVAIWFQDQFGDTPSTVLAQLSGLDWNELALDWTP